MDPSQPMASRPGPVAPTRAAHADQRRSGGFGPWTRPRPGESGLPNNEFLMGITMGSMGIWWDIIMEYYGNIWDNYVHGR